MPIYQDIYVRHNCLLLKMQSALSFSTPIKPFSRCLQLCIQKNLQTIISVYHFIEHEDSSLEAESCSCYGFCSNKVLRLTAVSWYFSLLVFYFRIGKIFFLSFLESYCPFVLS